MKKLTVLFLLGMCLFCSGCNLYGVLAEGSRDDKIPAELKLRDYAKDGVLVFVDNSIASGAELGLSGNLGEAVEALLVSKAGIGREYIIPQSRLSAVSAGRKDFSRLTPAEVAGALDAGVVLYVWIEDFGISDVKGRRYCTGRLISRSILFDAGDSRRLWPKSGQGRSVKTKVEFETAGREKTLARLNAATAHCIVRNFYDCPKSRFRVSDEQVSYGMELW